MIMDLVLLGACVLTGALLAGGAVWFWRGQRIAALLVQTASLAGASEEARRARDELENARGRLESARQDRQDLEELRKRNFDLGKECAGVRAELEIARQAHNEQVEQLTRLRQEVQDQFKLLAGDVLRTTNEDFVKRASELFTSQKELTAKEIDARAQALSDLIKPLGESLTAYDAALKAIEKERVGGFAEIRATLQTVSAQNNDVRRLTSNLVNALRAAPKTRGRWGEETLRRVMELSGMVEHCDFETEKHYRGEDEALRPDALIFVAGGRSIIVDAKAPVSAYLDALEAGDDDARDALMKRHANQLRERLSNLSSKSYWEKIPGSTDCVVMFVPGDNFVSAAFERDQDLFEDGVKARVLICTPTTFIALAKAISYGWRQEKLAQNALEVARLGRDLYVRLATMGDHLGDLGKHINNAAKKYNALVGSIESSVMPQARRFNDLGVEGTSKPLPELAEVDTVVRFPQANRDLLLTKGPE
jgi:DNA recombination protein RmuC